ncbi:DUF4199 domain-containing protein [Pedobacter frigoris]|uniref:DUF4199 domain-containing protein n=1 Tax=Pedobacter frigoris TaxID=2571272 RepID=UPI00292F61E0|nr:DUF4199 domain-containing protein [Pedobacter frigoris]
MEEKIENVNALENLKPEAAKSGIGLGLISLVLMVISAYILIGATSMWTVFLAPVFLGLLIPLGLVIYLSIDLRKKVGGYWNFRQATSGVFIMLLVSYVISNVGNYAFTKLIEPDMPSKMQSTVVDVTSKMMASQGVDQEAVEKKVDEMNAEFEKKQNGTFMQTFQGHLIGVVIVFVVSLLFGAIFKKDPPKYLIEE